MNNLSASYAIHQELVTSSNEVSEIKFDLKINHYAQWFFTIATWLIYSFFAMASYAASLWVMQDFLKMNGGNYIAIILLTIFLIVFPTALSLGKHTAYKSLAKTGEVKNFLVVMFVYFIVSGIYYETVTASTQQHEKTYQQVDNKGNATPSIVISGSSEMSTQLANAEKKLAQCKAKLGKPGYPHCNGDSALVNSLKSQQAATLSNQSSIASATITAAQTARESELDNRAQPIAKAFAKLFNSANAVGMVIASIIGALLFELGHAATVYSEWELKSKLSAFEESIKAGKVQYFESTGKDFRNGDFNESHTLDLSEMRDNGVIKDFRNGLDSPDEDAISKPGKQGFTGFVNPAKTAQPTQTENRAYLRPTPSVLTGRSLREALREGRSIYRDIPLDALLSHTISTVQGVENTDYTVSSVGTQPFRVPTQHGNTLTTDKRVAPVLNRAEGCCKWCGALLSGRQKSFCSTPHKDAYWNWRTPATHSKRTKRV
jgi:hypothetical protein